MSERLVVDSFMTADGEVVQLPTLGPLGPVDAEGGRIPLMSGSCRSAYRSTAPTSAAPCGLRMTFRCKQ